MNFINAQAILNYTQSSDIKLFAQTGKLVVDAPKGQITSKLQQCLVENKETILEVLTYHDSTFTTLNLQTGADWDNLKVNPSTLCISCYSSVRLAPALADNRKFFSCPWYSTKPKLIH